MGNRLDIETVAALDAAVLRSSETGNLRAMPIRAGGRMFCVGGAIDEFGITPDLRGPLSDILTVAIVRWAACWRWPVR